jgi:hypothetical protein
MVQSQLFGLFAAILADIPVTAEYLYAGQLSLNGRAPNQINKANY